MVWMDSAKGGEIMEIGLPIKQDTSQASVEVYPNSGKNFLEDVGVRASLMTARLLVVHVVGQDLLDRMGVRKGNQLLVLGHVFPVVNKNGLQRIRHRNLNRWSIKKGFLLFQSIVSKMPSVTYHKTNGSINKCLDPAHALA